MITISTYGLDQYTIGHYSKVHTANLAEIFETEEDNISFCAPEVMFIHKGIDQASWNSLVRVNAPEKFRPFQDKVASYLIDTLKDFTINLAIEFTYYEEGDRYEHQNEDYPRFLKDDNLVNVEEEEEDGELYMGNMFENFEEKIEEIRRQKEDDDFKKS